MQLTSQKVHLSQTIHDWHRSLRIVTYRAIIYAPFSKSTQMTVTVSNKQVKHTLIAYIYQRVYIRLPILFTCLLDTVTDLNLTKIHVDSITISPVSLEHLNLSDVPGSLKALLLSLPDCKHLTYLRIYSNPEKQDAKLLADVLPWLTQVRDMQYWFVRQRDTGNEGVVVDHSAASQVVARMTGLKRLNIYGIDMGDLALTPTSLMTHIKRMRFAQIQMTASSWDEFILTLSWRTQTLMINRGLLFTPHLTSM